MIDVKAASDDELRAHADSLMPAIEAGALGTLTKKGREEHKARCAEASACYEELMHRHFARKTPEQQRAWIDGLRTVATAASLAPAGESRHIDIEASKGNG